MQTPEWDLFKRIEALEEKTKAEFTVQDATILATIGLQVAFRSAILHTPQYAREYKDRILGNLKKMRVNRKMRDMLEEDFTSLSNTLEQKLKEMKR